MQSHQKENPISHEQIIISLVLDGLEGELSSFLQHSKVSGVGAVAADKRPEEETGISSPISSRSILTDHSLLKLAALFTAPLTFDALYLLESHSVSPIKYTYSQGLSRVGMPDCNPTLKSNGIFTSLDHIVLPDQLYCSCQAARLIKTSPSPTLPLPAREDTPLTFVCCHILACWIGMRIDYVLRREMGDKANASWSFQGWPGRSRLAPQHNWQELFPQSISYHWHKPTPMDLAKRNLRRIIKQERLPLLSRLDIEVESKRVIDQLLSLPAVQQAHSFSVYSSMAREVQTHDLIIYLLSQGKQVSIPKIMDSKRTGLVATTTPINPKTTRLSMVTLSSTQEYESLPFDNWGIKTPPNSYPQFLDPIHVVVVPCVALDSHGNRLGHGRGYYDEWLSYSASAQETLKIGVCLSCQFLPPNMIIPVCPSDVKLDVIIHPSGIIHVQRD